MSWCRVEAFFLDRPTLGGIHETFFHRILQGVARAHLSGDYRWTVAATWQRRLGENCDVGWIVQTLMGGRTV
jgi:hypothetical protein